MTASAMPAAQPTGVSTRKRAAAKPTPRQRPAVDAWGATPEDWALLDRKLEQLHKGNQELLKAVRALSHSFG